ncbi:hypothetical protein BDV59DRAFT_195688 [Aspergillus ambiguus]|uniref:bZIP transcription factor n=1 Tax=Aspergillus ambiguus TaxID=176160 RepID=UPI003CCD897E
MPQQADIQLVEEDWTGVIDQKTRRKLQNRLNQRRYRLRKQAEGYCLRALPSPSSHVSSSTSPHRVSSSAQEEQETLLSCTHAPPHAVQFRQRFEALAYESYLRGSPNRDHLISLSRLNVHKAIHENITAIGMTPSWMISDDSISIFNLKQPSFTLEEIPLSLRPTLTQLQIPHHPWLDFFPFPRMRDVMILAGDSFDDDDLCHDLMAFWDTRNTAATLLVWGNSWEPMNWEVTEAFAYKWRWLLRECPGLLTSTNSWRRSRGDEPLNWKYILHHD